MSRLLPVAVYGLEVPPGDVMVPASIDFPATIRITMAALDPTQEPEADEEGNIPNVPRSTLRIIKQRAGGDDEDLDSDEEDDEYLQALLGDDDDEDEDEDGDDEPNGGPSDPAKSKKARQEAALKKLLEAAAEEEDEDMDEDDAKPNGVKSKKGKQIAVDEDDEEDSDDDSEDMGMDMEQFVICTLDTERNYNQPLDITIGEGEKAFFVVSGTHAVHLTGNYIIDDEEEDSDEEDDDDYDLPPDMDELVGGDDASSDELDDVDMIERVQEIDTDEEEAPKLVKKGKNKRAAEDEAETLDDMIAKQGKTEEPKLSKKQQKKLKNNKGEPVAVEEPKSAIKENATPKSDKKVQFAKNLELGPTGSAEKPKQAAKGALGVKTIQGITVDDRKLGSGKAAKSGDKVSMRYIGKLESNGKVFDSNKKGSPFSFKLGRGEVIKGWDIGVAGMTVGGERRLTIPAPLAYGSSKTPGIPPNSTLVFDVKLLEIK